MRARAGRVLALVSVLVAAIPAAAGDPEQHEERACFAAPNRACVLAVALGAAGEIADAEKRASALREIAEAQAKAGQVEAAVTSLIEALANAREIRKAGDRADALGAIAKAQAKVGQIDAALATAREIADDVERFSVLSSIARALEKSGETTPARTFERVFEAARNLEGLFRMHALMSIASAQTKAGQTEAVLANARKIADAEERDLVLGIIAATQAEAGQLKALLATLELEVALSPGGPSHIEYYRARALRSIAAEQARTGQTDTAASTFVSALDAAREIAGAHDRARVLARIAQGLPK
jgi:tetratricopeptide (TPR) repeat protein